jgi:hypothetical protein
MVLDPFSALSLASNIIQFVDFSARLVTSVQKIYLSDSGFTDEPIELIALAHDLKGKAEFLINDVSLSQMDPVDQQSSRILTSTCNTLADKLISVLDDLKVEGPASSHRKWISFRNSVRAAARRKKIADLVSRMTLLRNALNGHLLVMLR